ATARIAKSYGRLQAWTNGARPAGQVMDFGGCSLLCRYLVSFPVATGITNSESIFEVNCDGTLDPGAGSVHTLFSISSGFPGGDAYGLMTVTPSLANLFAARDTRGKNATFIDTGYVDALGDTVRWNDPPANYGPTFLKYLDQTDFQNMHTRARVKQSSNWIVLRYADVL